jgi:hypothetical protein
MNIYRKYIFKGNIEVVDVECFPERVEGVADFSKSSRLSKKCLAT